VRIGLYQDVRGSGIGGGDYCLAVMANTFLADGHEVDLVHFQGPNYRDRLCSFFNIDISTATDRPLSAVGRWDAIDSSVFQRRSAMRGWMKDASAPYDAFICTTHSPPPYNHAPIGILYVLFPYFNRIENWPWNVTDTGLSKLKAHGRRAVYEKWWAERFRSYDSIMSISNFTRKWVKNYWGVESEVLFPPVELSEFEPSQKEDRIALLGRFTPVKKQLELARVFMKLETIRSRWILHAMGGLSRENPDDVNYLDAICRETRDCAEICVNASRDEVRSGLARSKIFWHAMGMDINEEESPALLEHFGIATVEAMASGCIPIVVNKGGQREIVKHGETGFLCDSIEQFAEYSTLLSNSGTKVIEMAIAAKKESIKFSLALFCQGMREELLKLSCSR
jgi:glycosyltransferase involved in cell wall biosynthesis